VAVAGHFLGRQVFVRLPNRHYEPIVLGSAFVAGVLSIGTALAAWSR
jgi:hypothetical protein